MENWYLIRCKPRKEAVAISYLTDKNVEIYFPMMERLMMRKGAFTKLLKPLFPSYMFGKFDVNEKYSLVQWGHGVKEIVSFGHYPLPVPCHIIETIKTRAEGGNIIKKARRFKKGDQVEITAGPFRSLTGIFDHWISDTERICILLNCIRYGARVDVHYSLAEHV